MESIVHFIMSNGTMVVTTLLGGIIFCVFGLLIMSFHSPKLAIAQELGSIDRLEGVLRQMLSDQKERPRESAGNASIDDGQISLLKEQITALENDVKEKQKQIDAAESGAGGESTQGEEAVGLKAKVEELEARLAEYSIIEEDISDLSKYRQENEELRKD